MPITSAQGAEIAAISDACFAFLVNAPDELAHFMAVAGYTPNSLRDALGTDSLERGLIDYFASNEKALIAMCDAQALDPQRFMTLWQRLNRSD